MKNKKKFIIVLLVVILFVISLYLIYKNRNVDSEKYLLIRLNGKKEVTLNYKEDYKDLGATASYKDKDITKDIVVKSDINFDKIGSYTYKYKIKYKKYTKEIIRTVIIKDNENPSITLNGDSEITLYNGSKYNEQGASATDNYDGDITANIKIDGSVDVNKNGEYLIKYTAVDTSNNSSSIERKIKIVDRPVIQESVNKAGKTSKGYNIENKNGIYYIDGIIIANKSYSLPSNYNPGGLLEVFNDNFNKMRNDALSVGISLNIISGYRSYYSQQTIYNNYVSRDGKTNADRYSARPGHSEHQTGLAADVNSLNQSFENTQEGRWLNDNCYKYGFIIRYVKGKENETGYIYEPWHIRYVGKDLAFKLYNGGSWITLEEYFGITSKY